MRSDQEAVRRGPCGASMSAARGRFRRVSNDGRSPLESAQDTHAQSVIFLLRDRAFNICALKALETLLDRVAT